MLRISEPGYAETSSQAPAALLFLFVCIPQFSATAGESDIAKQITCAAIKVFECAPENGCQEVMANDIDLPQVFRINFEEKLITGILDGKQRTTKIEYSEHIEGKVMLMGAEGGYEKEKEGVAWNAVIDKASGNLVVSASGDKAAFVVFGACIPR